MRENFVDEVKELFPLKNGNVIVKLEAHESVHDYDKAKSINTTPSHFGSYILSHSKRLLNEVNNQKQDFIIIVYTLEIPIAYIFIRNSGLTWLIMDSLVSLLAWVKTIAVTQVHFMFGF